ncbi:MAG TPA: dihydrofolate reductase family protein [Steroidobacteraceae bacterium]|jgi:riboflavin biosynthesis pyrimidine reductase|nr:dihydrofolate reductase family protein [Steroidobacteraceae bacterium]
MKPHVICHMVSSIDGRILNSRWRPASSGTGDLFERLHDELEGDAWLIGRTTGAEFSKGTAYPAYIGPRLAREPWIAKRDADAYGVVLDAHGRICWGRSDIGGDPIVVVMTENVSDAHLVGLRGEGISYFFAGTDAIDLPRAFAFLHSELGVERLLVEGGGGANGACLRAGLVDEISLVIYPTVDGAQGAPSVFDSRKEDAGVRAPVSEMSLVSSQVLDGGAVWLRYRLENRKA